MRTYPVEVMLGGVACLLVGGGKIAERKMDGLLDAGAALRVISPEVTERIRAADQAKALVWEKRPYRSGDVGGSFLVIAATDSLEVNDLVSREAREAGILCNVVDDPGRCNFTVPAVLRRGDFCLTVSTGGASPLLARRVRESLEEEFGPEYASYVGFLGRMRGKAMGCLPGQKEREAYFRQLVSDEYLALFRRGMEKDAEKKAEAVLGATVDHRNQG